MSAERLKKSPSRLFPGELLVEYGAEKELGTPKIDGSVLRSGDATMAIFGRTEPIGVSFLEELTYQDIPGIPTITSREEQGLRLVVEFPKEWIDDSSHDAPKILVRRGDGSIPIAQQLTRSHQGTILPDIRREEAIAVAEYIFDKGRARVIIEHERATFTDVSTGIVEIDLRARSNKAIFPTTINNDRVEHWAALICKADLTVQAGFAFDLAIAKQK